jgi:hypothetical protein
VGDCIGGITDPFRHHWHIATHQEDLNMNEIRRRAAAQGHRTPSCRCSGKPLCRQLPLPDITVVSAPAETYVERKNQAKFRGAAQSNDRRLRCCDNWPLRDGDVTGSRRRARRRPLRTAD